MAGKFKDLVVRTASALVLAVVGIFCLYQGGLVFLLMCGLIVGLMFRELLFLTANDPPKWYLWAFCVASGLSYIVISEVFLFSPIGIVASIGLPVVCSLAVRGKRIEFAIFGAMIFLAGFEFYSIRSLGGFSYTLPIVLIVVGTDVAGYLAGRLIGGPKLPTDISPNKSWAGTIAGWLVAVAIVFQFYDDYSFLGVLFGIYISVFSQLGDLAESWLKRRAGVKDSSGIIPGHGGALDRFDGMIGAGVALALYQNLII